MEFHSTMNADFDAVPYPNTLLLPCFSERIFKPITMQGQQQWEASQPWHAFLFRRGLGWVGRVGRR